LWRYEQRNVYGAIQKPCERSYGQLDAEFVTIHFGSLAGRRIHSTSTAAAAAIRKMAAQPACMADLLSLTLLSARSMATALAFSLFRMMAASPRLSEFFRAAFECLLSALLICLFIT